MKEGPPLWSSLTHLQIRIVLLHTVGIVQSYFSTTVFYKKAPTQTVYLKKWDPPSRIISESDHFTSECTQKNPHTYIHSTLPFLCNYGQNRWLYPLKFVCENIHILGYYPLPRVCQNLPRWLKMLQRCSCCGQRHFFTSRSTVARVASTVVVTANDDRYVRFLQFNNTDVKL